MALYKQLPGTNCKQCGSGPASSAATHTDSTSSPSWATTSSPGSTAVAQSRRRAWWVNAQEVTAQIAQADQHQRRRLSRIPISFVVVSSWDMDPRQGHLLLDPETAPGQRDEGAAQPGWVGAGTA
jgi:hypothetical protein